MNLETVEFLSSWLDDNIDCEALGAVDCSTLVERHVQTLLFDAKDSGVELMKETSLRELRSSVRQAMRNRTNAEIDRILRAG